MSLADRINELFSENPGKKAAHLAKFLNISRGSVSSWKLGKTNNIDGENAFRVAEYFGVNPEWVLNGKGEKYPLSTINNQNDKRMAKVISEERIIELEIKVAYQDELLESLNQALSRQQQQIHRLEQISRILNERLQNLLTDTGNNTGETVHEIPPHY